jgi:hypothetical protein
MRRRTLALAVVVALLLPACSSGHSSAAPPSTTTTTATTAAAPNPDVIPAVITPAYVNAVFRVLNHVNGNAVRTSLHSKAMSPEVVADLRAIYGGPLYPIEVQVFQQGMTQDLSNLRNPPGDRETRVLHVISASKTCIFVQAVSNLAAVEVHPTASVAAEFWRLQSKASTELANQLNPTPWILTYNQDFSSPESVANQC